MIKIPKSHIVIGKKELSKEEFKPAINNSHSNKPRGGLWVSPYYPDREYISGWHEWCSSEMEHWLSNDSVVLELKDDAKIFTINSQEDLIEFIKIVGIAEDELTSKLGLKFLTYPDFEKVSQMFDAVYLTEEGQWSTRFSGNGCDYNLYGWDCESLLILNFGCIEKWEYQKLDIVKENDK